MIDSPNFGFLEASLADKAIRAERYVFDDANTSLMKLRQFGELVARHVAAQHGLETEDSDFRDTVRMLKDKRLIPRELREMFDMLRLRGNEAVHEGNTNRQEALAALIAANKIAVWYHTTFIDDRFQAGPFRPPPNPANVETSLRDELESIREGAARYQRELSASRGEVKELERIKRELERESQRYDEKLRAINTDKELEVREIEVQLRALRNEAKSKTPSELRSFVTRSNEAARRIGLRGGQANYVPLAQIRIVSPCKSSCHMAAKLLAQASSGGFVCGYCSECGRKETVAYEEFNDLDLWVSCPGGHGRMSATMVRSNYGFQCESCGWQCFLASLLPKESDLGIA